MRPSKLFIALFVILNSTLIHAQEEKVFSLKVLDDFMIQKEQEGFSGQMLLAVQGKVVYNKGFGYSDAKKTIKNSPETVFEIGSIAKVYTRAAIAKLMEQGKLTIDTRLSEVYPQTPVDKKDITIRNLLNFRAGLRDYISVNGDISDFAKIDKQGAIDYILSSKLVFEPGTDRRYSNMSYTLLATIVEELSGMEYFDYLRKYIIPEDIPYHSEFGGTKSDELTAHGLDVPPFGEINSPHYWPMTWALRGAGGIVTSAQGLYSWYIAITRTDLIDLAYRKYVAGRGISPRGTPAFIVAGGGDTGFNSILGDFPEEGVTMIIQSNSPKIEAETLFPEISGMIFGEPDEDILAEDADPDGAKNQLQALLSIIASGDIEEFIKNHLDEYFIEEFGMEGNVQFINQVRSKYGEFEVVEYLEVTPFRASAKVKSKKTGVLRRLSVEIEPGESGKIAGLGVSEIGEGETNIPDEKFDNSQVQTIISNYISALKKGSPFEESNKKIEDGLAEYLQNDRYKDIDSPQRLASMLSDDIIRLTGDYHFGVDYNPRLFRALVSDASGSGGNNQSDVDRLMLEEEQKNRFYFEEISFIEHNLFYLKSRQIPRIRHARSLVDSLMNEALKSNGLVIDLRDNTGGADGFTQYLASYLLPENTKLFSRVNLRGTRDIYTQNVPAQKKHKQLTVYILVNNRTVSAAEQLAYLLQNHDRATIIGETTFGAAHGSIDEPLESGFVGFIPVAYEVHKKTGKDWEGTGVTPDIEASSDKTIEKLYQVINDK